MIGFLSTLGVNSWLVSKRVVKFDVVDKESCWWTGILLILFGKFPPVLNVVVDANEDVDELVIFIGIPIPVNSVEADLFDIGDVKNDGEHKFSYIGVFVLALAVWWCKLDKDEGVSRFTKHSGKTKN